MGAIVGYNATGGLAQRPNHAEGPGNVSVPGYEGMPTRPAVAVFITKVASLNDMQKPIGRRAGWIIV